MVSSCRPGETFFLFFCDCGGDLIFSHHYETLIDQRFFFVRFQAMIRVFNGLDVE